MTPVTQGKWGVEMSSAEKHGLPAAEHAGQNVTAGSAAVLQVGGGQ